MNVTFQSWMQAVWTTIMEPSATAEQALTFQVPRNALWSALALTAVLNVLFVVTLQYISSTPIAMQDQILPATPFGYLAMVGIFLVTFVFALSHLGRMLGGGGTLDGTLTIMVWFQAVSLTLEAVQMVLVLISPAIAALFGMLALGALIWCFINFIKVLHGFDNLIKTAVVVAMALIATALLSSIFLTVFGITNAGGTI
ncbi:YIP1 family protein [Loktanella sp. Alg231-35]|uniref:YIP1 family protein n=1 Tax=Loktanella sp. Alg231-35 TaxID=1922220 RepID=UPI000D5555D4|nr:YIP1 family protein [Loktanella sp. Alg231-35]